MSKATPKVTKVKPVTKTTKPVAKKEIKKVKASPEEIVKASLKPITKPAVKVAPKTPAKKPVAVKVSEVTEKPSEQELIKEKVKIMVKEKATEKAANPTPVVTKKAEPSSISFEDIKKHLLKVVKYKKEGVQGMTIATVYDSTLDLKIHLLPISIDDFVSLYISKCEARIKELEEELEELKD